MNKNIADYSGALKFAFSKAYGGDAADWVVGAETTGLDGKPLTEFRNAKNGILLQVSGQEDADFGKFNAKRVDAGATVNDEVNMSIPKSWKNLSA